MKPINPVSLIQLKAFARQDGAILGLLWTASFALMILFPANALSPLMAVATPFLVGWRLKSFRDNALEGHISFRRAFAYTVYTFFYAAIIFAFVQVIYFQFLDHGTFFNMLRSAIAQGADVYRQAGFDVDGLSASVETFQQLGAINAAFMFMMQNIVIGFILALPIAAIMKKA